MVIALLPYTHISARMDRSAVDRCAELAWARYKPAAPTAPAALADPVARCIAALFGNGAAPAAPEAPRAPAAAAMSAAVAMSESEDEDEEEEEELASHGDGRRTNRGRKARCTILIAEKLRWVERVEAQMARCDSDGAVWHTSRRTPGSGSGSAKGGRTATAVRAALEGHDKPYVRPGRATRRQGPQQMGARHQELAEAGAGAPRAGAQQEAEPGPEQQRSGGEGETKEGRGRAEQGG